MMAVQTSLNARDLPDNLKGIRGAIETAVPHGRTNHGRVAPSSGEMPERQRKRIQLMQGSLLYRDKRLSGFDAAAVVE